MNVKFFVPTIVGSNKTNKHSNNANKHKNMILKNVAFLQNLDPFEAAVSILLDFIEKQIITNILKLPCS